VAKKHNKWKSQFDGFDMVTQFIWISTKPTRFEEYDESKPQSLQRFEYPKIADRIPHNWGLLPTVSLDGPNTLRNVCLKDIGMHIWNRRC